MKPARIQSISYKEDENKMTPAQTILNALDAFSAGFFKTRRDIEAQISRSDRHITSAQWTSGIKELLQAGQIEKHGMGYRRMIS